MDFRSREDSGFRPTLTVTYSEGPLPSNDPPVADGQSVTVNEDTALPITLSASDPDGDSLTFNIASGPANGTLTGAAPNVTYTPNPDFHGTDSFRFKANDGLADSSSATIAISVNSVDDRPEANDLTAITYLDTPVEITLEGSDVDGDSLVYSIGPGPAHGRLDGAAPNLTYTPDAGFTGADTFSYLVSDGTLESVAAEVSISVLSAPSGIWIDSDYLMALPTSGPAWESLVSAADTSAVAPNLSDQDDNTDVLTLAKALVGVRLADSTYMAQAQSNIMAAIGTEDGGRTLALGRNLASYIIAADLVGLSPQDDLVFRNWLRETLTEDLDGRTLQSTHEDRPNNWGTMSGASRAAAALYLDDQDELARTAVVFKGYLGDRSSYAEFNYGSDLSWQADPDNPVGINPKGATKDGHNIDGILPDDMRRGGAFTWPAEHTGYPWEALQGALVQAEILYRAGYDTYEWEDRALLRAVERLYEIGWDAEGDDEWQTWLIDARYGTIYADNAAARHGKIMGWTSWTHPSSGGPTISAGDDAYPVLEDAIFEVSAPGVLANDIDPEGDPLTPVLVSNPANGSLTLNDDGSFTYTPNSDFNGSDSFTYRASDGANVSNLATVSLTVSAVNDEPVADIDSYEAQQDTPLIVSGPGVLANDDDVDGDQLTAVLVAGPSSGVLTLNTDGSFSYTPNSGFAGSDSFTYQAHDGTIDSNVAIVSITVSESPAGPNLQFGVVENVGEFWSTVTLPHAFTSMVVIATPNYDKSHAPGVVRIRDASGDSFQVRVDRAGGGAVGGVAVHYVVVEEGVYGGPGFKMEAVKYESTVTDENNSWVGQSRTYQQSYNAPVVVGQVMTYNDPDWSVFWAAGNRRNTPPSSSKLTVGKHVGEDLDATRADETIGYIVIETSTSGTQTIEGLPYVAAVGADQIRGVGNSPAYHYSYSAMANSKAAVVSQAGMDVADGGWAVLYGDDPITPTGSTLALAIDEDQGKDSERRHGTEQVAYLIIDPPTSESPPLPPDLVPSAVDLLISTSSVNEERPRVPLENSISDSDARFISVAVWSDHFRATQKNEFMDRIVRERIFADDERELLAAVLEDVMENFLEISR